MTQLFAHGLDVVELDFVFEKAEVAFSQRWVYYLFKIVYLFYVFFICMLIHCTDV